MLQTDAFWVITFKLGNKRKREELKQFARSAELRLAFLLVNKPTHPQSSNGSSEIIFMNILGTFRMGKTPRANFDSKFLFHAHLKEDALVSLVSQSKKIHYYSIQFAPSS